MRSVGAGLKLGDEVAKVGVGGAVGQVIGQLGQCAQRFPAWIAQHCPQGLGGKALLGQDRAGR